MSQMQNYTYRLEKVIFPVAEARLNNGEPNKL